MFVKVFENHSSPDVPPSHPLTSSDTPSQRVQFILGTEEDAEHVAHELFTELDEICVKDGKDAEWKETARSGCPVVAGGNSTGNKASHSSASVQVEVTFEVQRVIFWLVCLKLQREEWQ